MKQYTKEELDSYYRNNRKYFDEIARYFYENDKEYYNSKISSYYTQLQWNEIFCPYCRQKTLPNSVSKISTGGWIMILIGIVFSPILIGILFILLGMGMKEYSKYCSNCKTKIS